MKTKVYAVAEKVPEDCGHLTAGKLYQVGIELNWIDSFEIMDDDCFPVVIDWRNKAFNWTRLELPDVDPRDVAALIEAAEWAADVLGMCAQAEHETDAHDNLVTVLNNIKGDE